MKKIILFLLSLISVSQLTTAQGIDKPQYQIVTHRGGVYLGIFNIELFPLIAPLATRNFDSLVTVQAYDSTAFHRVVPGFVVQGGDPNSINGPVSTWGNGNPNQPNVNAEFSAVHHYRGRIGAARDANINSANSQFYACVASALFLDGNYTVFGQVTSGMNIVDTIVNSPTVPGTERPVQKIEMFITYTGIDSTIPAAPLLVSPANNALGVSLNFNFQWSVVSDAVMYSIEFSYDSLFTNIIITKDAGNNAATVPGLQASKHYYWRVKSNNGGHESVFSNVFSFNSIALPPQLFSPYDTATNVYLNPVFSWSDVEPSSTYVLQVSTSSVFTTSSMIYNQSGLSDTIQMVTGLNPNTTYWWRVRSTVGQPGVYSTKYSFTTGTTIGLESNQNLFVNSIYPNPVQDVLTIDALLYEPGIVKVSLTNNVGQQVYYYEQKINQQKFTSNIDVSKFEAGIYFLNISLNDQIVVRKITVQ